MKTIAAWSLGLVLLVAGAGSGQPVSLIEDEIDVVRRGLFRLGPVYVTPSLQVSSGYDSNALSTPAAVSDVNAVVGPAALVAIPFGNIAFFDVHQEVDFVYYREQVDLRRVFDVTRVGGGIGSRRVLLRVTDEFRDETGRPTSEFDFPVHQRSSSLDASLTLALGWRHALRFGYARERFEIADGLDDELVAARLNRVQDRSSLALRRRLTSKTFAVAEAQYERFAFEDASRDADSYGARFGFDFNPGRGDALTSTPWSRSFLAGSLLFGLRKVAPREAGLVDFMGWTASTDVMFGFGGGHRLSGLLSRDVVPSIFEANWFFVENRFGGSFRYQLTERLAVTPGITVGTNRYPLRVDGEDANPDAGGEEIEDVHRTYRLAIEVRAGAHWTVGAQLDYLERTSNVFAFQKDRFQAGLILQFRP